MKKTPRSKTKKASHSKQTKALPQVTAPLVETQILKILVNGYTSAQSVIQLTGRNTARARRELIRRANLVLERRRRGSMPVQIRRAVARCHRPTDPTLLRHIDNFLSSLTSDTTLDVVELARFATQSDT